METEPEEPRLAVGQSATFGLSQQEVIEILSRHVCVREGIDGWVMPCIDVVVVDGKLSHVDVTVRRTR